MNNFVSNWKYLNQVEGEDRKRSSHVLMSNDEVTELTWENGQLAIHEISGPFPNKPKWDRLSDTLESMVHQATSTHNHTNPELSLPHHCVQFNSANASSPFSFSFEKSIENSKFKDVECGIGKKRMRLDPDQFKRNPESSFPGGLDSLTIGGNAAFSRENDAPTLMMRTSLDKDPPNLKPKTKDDDSACRDGSENMDQEEQQGTKGETSRSNSMRRNRAAGDHNQSERRRRDRINQKMKALQKLVPNASKNDKASMLDEVIVYLKQLQAQVKMMNARTVPQMIPALAMQQQMQMSLLARMGMGVGLGVGPTGLTAAQTLPQIVSPAQIAPANSPFFSLPFIMPPLVPNSNENASAINNSASFNHPYSSFFAQPMNMDLYNKMAAIYQQQMNQTNQPTTNPLSHNNVQGG